MYVEARDDLPHFFGMILQDVERIVDRHSKNPSATFEVLSAFWRVRSDQRPCEERLQAKDIVVPSLPGKTWANGLRKRYYDAGQLFIAEPVTTTWTADDAQLISATMNTTLKKGQVKLLAICGELAAQLAIQPRAVVEHANTHALPTPIFTALCELHVKRRFQHSNWTLDEDALLLSMHLADAQPKVRPASRTRKRMWMYGHSRNHAR